MLFLNDWKDFDRCYCRWTRLCPQTAKRDGSDLLLDHVANCYMFIRSAPAFRTKSLVSSPLLRREDLMTLTSCNRNGSLFLC